jgi:hypothetical protein
MKLLKSKVKTATPSQKFVEIQDIRDDVIILKNGGLRAVCVASSINFDLKESAEQEALIIRYQQFLNSLDFSLQVLINSRKLDINPYLENLKELSKTQKNELLQAQTIEYAEFVQKFVELTDIMNKVFYVVIPYNPIGAKKEKFFDKIKYIIKPKETVEKISPEKFQEYKTQLLQRVDHVITGLGGLEIKSTPLNTDQLTSLIYSFYNPGAN